MRRSTIHRFTIPWLCILAWLLFMAIVNPPLWGLLSVTSLAAAVFLAYWLVGIRESAEDQRA